MTFFIRELPKAQLDKRHIVGWLFERSPQGAAAWLDAYDQMVERLQSSAPSFPLADENSDVNLEIRQVLFKTSHGRVYRAIFHIERQNVYVLRIRGPGQAPGSENELAS